MYCIDFYGLVFLNKSISANIFKVFQMEFLFFSHFFYENYVFLEKKHYFYCQISHKPFFD